MKTDNTPKLIQLNEYEAPKYFVENIYLTVELDPKATKVYSRLQIKRNGQHQEPLILNIGRASTAP